MGNSAKFIPNPMAKIGSEYAIIQKLERIDNKIF